MKEEEEALVFFLRLERDLSESTWQGFIGWRKTLVLRHSLIERFLHLQTDYLSDLSKKKKYKIR